MELGRAQCVAAAFCDAFKAGVEKLAIAGSVRRQVAEVGNIEVVAVPKFKAISRPGTLFPTTVNLAHQLTESLCDAPRSEFSRGPKCGAKWRQLIYTRGEDQIKIDLFLVDACGWGPQLAIRTGPADFSRLLVSRAMREGFQMTGGRIIETTSGETVPLEIEAEFFQFLGLPHWQPRERNAFALSEYLDRHALRKVS